MAQDSFFRRQIGIPIEQTLGPQSALAQGAEQAGIAAQNRLNALNQMANPQNSPGMAAQAGGMGMASPNDSLPDNAPSMSPADAQSRAMAMAQAPGMMQQAAAKLRAQAALDQQAEEHANHIGEDIDMSKYQPYQQQAPAPRQFPHIQKKMQSGQPVNSEDIRATMKPNQALSEDQEAALNKQLSGDDEEEADAKKQRALNNNNRAGSAEGSYSGS